MPKKIKFSIVMPTYNSEKTIKKSIQSVINQKYTNWELVIVDDGSTDRTAHIVDEFIGNNSIIYIKQDNVGPGLARNNGMKHCTGDYIGFLDSDDYFAPEYLMSVYEKSDNGKVDVIFTDRIYEDAHGFVIGKSNIYDSRNLSKDQLIKRQMTGLIPWGVGKIFKKELRDRAVGFTKLQVGEEALFAFDVLNNAHSFAFVEKPMLHVLRDDGGQHSKGSTDPWYPVINAMYTHVSELSLLDKYRTNINSFAIRGLCISVYRCSQNNSILQATKEIKKAYEKYRNSYDLSDFNCDSLDFTSKTIYLCLRFRLFFLIYIASKIRSRT